jgi:filamentous hemagglutinin family protein
MTLQNIKATCKPFAALRPRVLAFSVAACFTVAPAFALPTGGQVVAGSVKFNNATPNSLVITNTPGAIINWNNFSVGAIETVKFQQQSSLSSVLNRVTGNTSSSIQGALLSNGRVFLLNPNGILFGAGSKVDVGGLVASTLNISDSDFRKGKLNFQGGENPGTIQNAGTLDAAKNIYLIAPDIENSGILRSAQGEILLAAGRQVSLVDGAHPDIQIVVSAPADKAVNLGDIAAGKISIFGALVQQKGKASADRVEVDEKGRIVFKATKQLDLEAGSQTTASGPTGGSITLQTTEGDTYVKGSVSATAKVGAGGTAQVLGQRVAVMDQASIDVSGETGGGTILIGGDYQGKNAAVQNSTATWFGPDASLKANANTNGDGGKVIVWADDVTRAYGSIEAKGGAQQGNGGFIETSGKGSLEVAGIRVNTGGGTWLLDPYSIVIDNSSTTDVTGSPNFTAPVSPTSYLNVSDLLTALYGGSVTVTANDDLTVSSAISDSANAVKNDLSLTATGGTLTIAAPITLTNVGLATTSGGATAINGAINLGTGIMSMSAGSITQTSAITASSLDVAATSGSVTLMSDNVVGSLTANVASAGDLFFKNTKSSGLDISSDAIIGGANDVGIWITQGELTQSGQITADSLVIRADQGNVILGHANNNVSSLAGQVGTSSTYEDKNFLFKNSTGFTVSNGLTSNGSFSSINGISIANSSSSYTSGTDVGVIHLVATSGSIQQSASGVLTAKAVRAVAQATNAAGSVLLTEANPTGVIAGSAGSASYGGDFKYTTNASAGIKVTEVGDAIGQTAGITGSNSGSTVKLVASNGSVSQDALIDVRYLAASATGNISLTYGSNSIGNFALTSSGGGSIALSQSGRSAMTVDTVDGITGISTTGDVTVKNTYSGGTLTVSNDVYGGSLGEVSLSTYGDLTVASTVTGKNVWLGSDDLISVTGSVSATQWGGLANVSNGGTLEVFDTTPSSSSIGRVAYGDLANITTGTGLALGNPDTTSGTTTLTIAAPIARSSGKLGLLTDGGTIDITQPISLNTSNGYLVFDTGSISNTSGSTISAAKISGKATGTVTLYGGSDLLISGFTTPSGPNATSQTFGGIEATGAVYFSNSGYNIGSYSSGLIQTSSALTLSAGSIGQSGTPLQTQTGSLSFVGSSGAYVNNTGALTLTSGAAPTGPINLTSTGTLTVTGTVNAGNPNTISLTAPVIDVHGGNIYGNTTHLTTTSGDLKLRSTSGGTPAVVNAYAENYLSVAGNLVFDNSAYGGSNAYVVAEMPQTTHLSFGSSSGGIVFNSGSPGTTVFDTTSGLMGIYHTAVNAAYGAQVGTGLLVSTGLYSSSSSSSSSSSTQTIDSCIANPTASGCSAVLPPLDTCVTNPTATGCSVVLPPLSSCVTNPTAAGCSVVLPPLDSCVTNPTATGCSVVLPPLSSCVTNPTAAGCSVVLPPLDSCVTNPTATGCSVVLPPLSSCVTNPTAPGCSVVLPPLDSCVTNPTAAGCSVVLPPLSSCVTNPTAPGCSVVLPPNTLPTDQQLACYIDPATCTPGGGTTGTTNPAVVAVIEKIGEAKQIFTLSSQTGLTGSGTVNLDLLPTGNAPGTNLPTAGGGGTPPSQGGGGTPGGTGATQGVSQGATGSPDGSGNKPDEESKPQQTADTSTSPAQGTTNAAPAIKYCN